MADKPMRSTRPGGYHALGPGGLGIKDFARWYRRQSLEQWEKLDLAALERIARLVESTRAAGSFIWVCGNGGSAATGAHIGCDFGKTAAARGRKPLKAVSLCDNTAFMTAIGNDLSFDETFSRQLENVAGRGDLVLLISGSGNSPNLLRAARTARAKGAKVVSLLGFDGGKLKALSDEFLLVPSDQYGVVEDMHMSIAHVLTFYLKQKNA
ncbi:MAG: SIS domain-containing protein [Elusimicrobiota bacterium]|nr:SIS domain-containing protein [Elusimicrobiota bacterium]